MPKATQTPSRGPSPHPRLSTVGAFKKPARQLRLCTKCPGRPFRVMCEHTKLGRLHLQNERERTLLSAGPPAPTQIPQTENLALRLSPTPLEQLHEQISPLTHNMELAGTSPTLEETVPPSPVGSTLAPAVPAPLSTSASSGAVKTRGKRVRPMASNPVFGLVQGVYRGEVPHSVHRGHVLPMQIDKQDKCQKQFLEGANSIILKCEDLAAQTGCWLFVGMQHATARAAPLHYASPRFRNDAPTAVADFGRDFCTTMDNLLDARRRDTFEVEQNLRALEVEKGNLEQELVSLRGQIVGGDALLHRYQEAFGPMI
ncbi:hypothetical protein HYPSUDRAFT_180779 [Hypholoma sublateritium FD-334 SS-4]|uniref:Uncharacterized protein n=1 Tax=Hypholoma sublateritium (strain FD-334 SS-4) TaxID=945553 RepID=A0A0D2LG82_HYPSF|nr:hypothetical protein HYPSUDRAFT_180779 [Hypholoma sublateritium FD-334 SS-4]